MSILRAPDGRAYSTEDEREVAELTLGHGYTLDQPAEPERVEAAPKTAGSRGRRALPADAKHETSD